MKVLFIPYFKGNPYQGLLASALEKKGVHVVHGRTDSHFPVLKSVRNEVAEVVHLHWTHPFLIRSSRWKTRLRSSVFMKELRLLKLKGIGIVWTVHNLLSHDSRYPDTELLFHKKLARLSDEIIVHSPHIRKEVIDHLHIREDEKVKVILHGNYISVYSNKLSKEEARSKLGIAINEKVFLYFGYIKEYKNIPGLINAFQDLNAEGCRLIIAGNPESTGIKRMIEAQAEGDEKIDLHLRFIKDDEIQVYMNAADFVVLPLKDALTSGSLILAMSFGKGVIAPKFGYILDVLDAEGGLIYEHKLPGALKKSLAQVIKMGGDEITKMGMHNLELAKKLDWEGIAEKTISVYKESLCRDYPE